MTTLDLIFYKTRRHPRAMESMIKHKAITVSYLLVVIFSCIALFINFHYLHYVGNNYFPKNNLIIELILILILAGTYLQFNQKHITFLMAREIFFFYLIMTAIGLFTNAVQYTPFNPIDAFIIKLESSLKIDMTQMVAWTAQQPQLKKVLILAYNSLVYQMVFLPLFIILMRDLPRIRAYYFLLLSNALIGFSIYYFFPTTAPASNLNSPFFFEVQRATGIKFHEIHNHLTPTTNAGGMIAFPSFHVIWAWCGLYLIYHYRWLFFLLLPLNGLLIVSCVLLGWHYPLDLLGSALTILISYWLHHQFKNNCNYSACFAR